ncbi:MAG: alpha/beta hydrolase [Pleurocapsa sp.]
MIIAKKISQWLSRASLIILTTSITVSVAPERVLAAQEVIFKYGVASHSVSIQELENFVATGETTPAINFLIKTSRQNPATLRWMLAQKFPVDTQLVNNLLDTPPGEYFLTQSSDIVNTRSERADVQALRGALITSASDDSYVSFLELLQNYPTQKVYVDAKKLAKTRRNMTNSVEQVQNYITIPLRFVRELFPGY